MFVPFKKTHFILVVHPSSFRQKLISHSREMVKLSSPNYCHF
jgi:hypothetical protein